METKIIKTKCGAGLIVDDFTYPVLSRHKWLLNGKGYGVRGLSVNGKYKALNMHKAIALMKYGRYDKKLWIDHINRDKLDNRFCNIRVCTPSQNAQNRTRPESSRYRSSKYLGVTAVHNKNSTRYSCTACFNGKKYYKLFDDEIEAARHYNEKALEHHGNHALINPV
jgi:hypothetical protein